MKVRAAALGFAVLIPFTAAQIKTSHGAKTPARDFGPSLEPALRRAMQDYDTAQIHGDFAELMRLVAADYVIVRPGGLGDRAGLIKGMTHAGMHLQPYTVQQPFTRNFGSTVVAGGWVELIGVDGTEPFHERFRFSDVWTKREGRWYVVMTQLTPAEKP